MNNFKLTAAHPITGSIDSYYQVMLLVLFGQHKLTAAQFEIENQQLISLFDFQYDPSPGGDFLSDLKALLESEEVFNRPYRSVISGSYLPYSTLVPRGLFTLENRKAYLDALYHLPQGKIIMHDEINPGDMVNVYCIPADLYQLITEKFTGARHVHYLTSLLKGLRMFSREAGKETIYCHLRDERMDVLIFRDTQLLFSNSFHFSNKEELVYYLLFIMEQLSIGPDTRRILFFGETAANAEAIKYSREYLGDVFVGLGKPSGYGVDPSLGIEEDVYYNLLSLSLCV